jgi:hypothetical protein
MKKIYIGGKDTGRIYDVSSPDPTISRAASKAIQDDFDKAAREIGVLIRQRINAKARYNK